MALLWDLGEKMQAGKARKKLHTVWEYGIPFVTVCILAVFFFVRYGYHYISNDDCLLESILSGSFCGTPNGHNLQHLYPLSFLIASFYKRIPGIPWYGIFLLVCQFGSLYVCLVRLMKGCKSKTGKLIGCFLVTLAMAAFLLQEWVLIQYTMTSAILICAAIFLLLTIVEDEEQETARLFLKKRIGVLLLYVLGFMVRSEMGLMLLPFMVLVCGYHCLLRREVRKTFGKTEICFFILFVLSGIFAVVLKSLVLLLVAAGVMLAETIMVFVSFIQDNRKQFFYYLLFGALLLGLMAGCLGVDKMAYSSSEWKEARDFFDARTDIYDFGLIPGYEEEQEFYQSIGLTEHQQILLDQYNFLFDDSINSSVLQQVNERQKTYFDYVYTRFYLKKLLLESFERMTAQVELPYGIVSLVLYGVFLVTFLAQKKFFGPFYLAYIIMLRVGCWSYLLSKGRSIARVTHGLYLAEAVLLSGILVVEFYKWRQAGEKGIKSDMRPDSQAVKKRCGEKTVPMAGLGLLAMITLFCMFCNESNLKPLQEQTKSQEENWMILQGYFAANSDNYYLIDTYSLPNYSQNVGLRSEKLQNYSYAGGWVVNNPLYHEKLHKFGLSGTIETTIREGETLYFVLKGDREIGWLEQYFQSLSPTVTIQETDCIETNQSTYVVYRIN